MALRFACTAYFAKKCFIEPAVLLVLSFNLTHHKGSAIEFSKYLKSLQPDDIEEISRKIERDQGVIGVEYIRHRLQVDINKNEVQLATDRDRLWREGHDIGRVQNKGLRLG